MMRFVVFTAAVAWAVCAEAFLAPTAEGNGVRLSLPGFEEKTDKRELGARAVTGAGPLAFDVTLENIGDGPVSGTLRVALNDDWDVDVPEEKATLAPGERRSFPRRATARASALTGLYPVHATFASADGEVHPIAIFKYDSGRKPERMDASSFKSGEPLAAEAAQELVDRALAEARINGAAAVPGPNGLFDGAIAFAKGARSFAFRGFNCKVDGRPCGRPQSVETKKTARGLEVLHRYADGVTLRATVRSESDGALTVAWDMPGAKRARNGSPRYTELSPGCGTLPAERLYLGFGNVIVRPRKGSFAPNGFTLSTRHVGVDYENGLSVVQAVSVPPDTLACDREKARCALVAHNDATFTFIASDRGAFAAAKVFAGRSGYRRGPGVDSLMGRTLLDNWGSDVARATDDLRALARYGVNDAIYVHHSWQRWGYDYRLPEIYPPSAGLDAFRELREACGEMGALFCPHDNYTDIYPDARGFSYDLTVFDADGRPQLAWYNVGRRAQSYRWAPHAFRPWLEENARLMKAGFAPDALFIDVLTAHPAFDYYERTGAFHPKTDTARFWGEAFSHVRTQFGRPKAPMLSEAGTDSLIGAVDGCESDHFSAARWMGPGLFDDAERVPWHDIVTHGKMVLFAGGLANRYAAQSWEDGGDMDEHGYGSDDYLANTVIGGRLPMAQGTFLRRTVMTHWLLNDVCSELQRAEFKSFRFEGDDIHRLHSFFSEGGEVLANRGTNSTWRIPEIGCALPTYGFYAQAGRCVAGVVELPSGDRVAYSRAPGRMFFDARPPSKPVTAHARAMSSAASGETHDAVCRVRTDWRVMRPAPGYAPFVHVVPENGGEAPIVAFGELKLPEGALEAAGGFEATLAVRVPDRLPAGRYDIRYGLFSRTGRLEIAGDIDRQLRVRGGTLVVTKTEDGKVASVKWEPPRQKWMDAKAKTVDFGVVKTDGAFRLLCPERGDWKVQPLPGSLAFTAEIALRDRRKVAEVLAAGAGPAPDWRQDGDRLTLRFPEGSEGCTLRWR